jgi:hypothetical protein
MGGQLGETAKMLRTKVEREGGLEKKTGRKK